MDFFKAQDRARFRTTLVLSLAALALCFIILLSYASGMVVWKLLDGRLEKRRNAFRNTPSYRWTPDGLIPNHDPQKPQPPGWWNPKVFLFSAGGAIILIVGGSLRRLRELQAGGNAIAHELGAVLIPFDTLDLGQRTIINIVEELSIASSVPIPEVFVLDEEGINSFCAGHAIDNAVLIVTRGAMDHLSRDELQAILAHEFSHILNGDMRINTQMVGVLHGFLMFSITGQHLLMLRFVPALVGGALLVALGWIGQFLGSIIQAVLCRQREWLADAHALQFTRNPDALVSAMKKIAGHFHGSEVNRPYAIESAHMFFANALDRSHWTFRTHPPLTKRIRAIDPHFDGYLPPSRYVPKADWRQRYSLPRSAVSEENEVKPIDIATNALAAATIWDAVAPAASAATVDPVTRAERVASFLSADGIGIKDVNIDTASPEADDIGPIFNKESTKLLPAPLFEATLDSTQAPRIVMCLARQITGAPSTGDGADCRPDPFAVFADLITPEDRASLEHLQTTLSALPPELFFVLLAQLLPALETRSPEWTTGLLKAMDRLLLADFRITLEEFAFRHIIRRRLKPGENASSRTEAQLKTLIRHIIVLLSAVSHRSGGDPASRQDAFWAGINSLPEFGGDFARIHLISESALGAPQLIESLRRLDAGQPELKKATLHALVETAQYDGALNPAEQSLLNLVSAVIDYPLPATSVPSQEGMR